MLLTSVGLQTGRRVVADAVDEVVPSPGQNDRCESELKPQITLTLTCKPRRCHPCWTGRRNWDFSAMARLCRNICTVRLGDNCSAKWLPCCRHLPMILSNLTKKSFRFLSKFFQIQLAAYFGSTRTRRFQLRARLLRFVVLSYTSYP